MSPHADIMITHARCFTADPANPHAEAGAVRGNRIVFVGSDVDGAAWRGPGTRVIDAQGCTLMPGFVDSHFHLLLGSIGLGDAQLGEVRSYEALAEALRAFAGDYPRREWLVGYGLPYAILPCGRVATRGGPHPLFARRPPVG